MIDLLNFSKVLAAALQQATGITVYTEGDAEQRAGEFSDALVLSLGGTNEVVALNATNRVVYRLAYMALPSTYTDSDLLSRRSSIHDAVIQYIDSLERYTELGGAVVLQAQASPWEVNYDGPQVQYSIPLDFVVQF